MPLTGLAVDAGPHNMDGLLLHAWDGPERVEAFISRRVMDSWVDPREPYRSGLLAPSTSAVRRSTASIHSWIFCCPTSWKAKRRSIRAN